MRSTRAHSIGVSVSDTKPETMIATEMVTANSRNTRPTMPPIRRTGINTAMSEKGLHIDRARHQRAVLRQLAADRIHDRNGVGVRLTLDGENNGAVVVEPARDLVVLDAVDDTPDLVEVDRGAVTIGDHDLSVFR